MNVKDIAATLAILGSGALLIGCGKEKPTTEVPTGGDAAGDPAGDAAGDTAGDAMGGEAKCGGADHTGEGHCGDEAAGAEGGDAAAGEEGGDAAAGEEGGG